MKRPNKQLLRKSIYVSTNSCLMNTFVIIVKQDIGVPVDDFTTLHGRGFRHLSHAHAIVRAARQVIEAEWRKAYR